MKDLPDFGKVCFPVMRAVALQMFMPQASQELLGFIQEFIHLNPNRRTTAEQVLHVSVYMWGLVFVRMCFISLLMYTPIFLWTFRHVPTLIFGMLLSHTPLSTTTWRMRDGPVMTLGGGGCRHWYLRRSKRQEGRPSPISWSLLL